MKKVIPPLSREESLEFWGLSTSHHWSELDHRDDGLDGFVVLYAEHGNWQANGGTVHRGVLHADEHLDSSSLEPLLIQRLGFSLEEVAEAYRPGRPSADRLRLRGRIDERLLGLQRKGGNMLALARSLGWSIIEEKSECRKMSAALSRARAAESRAA